jgi:hypothetical protein
LTKLKAAKLLLAQTIECRYPNVNERPQIAEKVFGAVLSHCGKNPQALSSSRLAKFLALTSAIKVGRYRLCQSLLPKDLYAMLLCEGHLDEYGRNCAAYAPT